MLYERLADNAGHFNFSCYTEKFHPKMRDIAKLIPHFHNSIEIVAVKSGEIAVLCSGEIKRVRAGELVYIDRLVPHDVWATENVSELKAFVFVITPSYFSAIGELDKSVFDKFLPRSDGCAELFELIEWGFSRFPSMNEEMKTGFATMLLGTLIKIYPMRERQGEKQTRLMFGVLEYIDAHYTECITLAGLAAHFGYEKTYLSKIINSSLGMNLREYLNRYRIAKVDARLKKEKEESPLFVAYECGFDSPNTFYRAYKKYSSTMKHNF